MPTWMLVVIGIIANAALVVYLDRKYGKKVDESIAQAKAHIASDVKSSLDYAHSRFERATNDLNVSLNGLHNKADTTLGHVANINSAIEAAPTVTASAVTSTEGLSNKESPGTQAEPKPDLN